MKEYYLTLPDGKMINVKGKTYDDLLCNIDLVIDKINESCTYYLGYSDDTIIEELQDDEVDIEVIDND